MSSREYLKKSRMVYMVNPSFLLAVDSGLTWVVDADEENVPPRVGPSFSLDDLRVDEPLYDFKEIRLSDILVLSERSIKVNLFWV